MAMMVQQAVWAFGAVLLMITVGSGAGLAGAALIRRNSSQNN